MHLLFSLVVSSYFLQTTPATDTTDKQVINRNAPNNQDVSCDSSVSHCEINCFGINSCRKATEGIRIECPPDTIDCQSCIIRCNGFQSCEYASIFTHQCANVTIYAANDDALHKAIIYAPSNGGNLQIIGGYTDVETPIQTTSLPIVETTFESTEAPQTHHSCDSPGWWEFWDWWDSSDCGNRRRLAGHATKADMTMADASVYSAVDTGAIAIQCVSDDSLGTGINECADMHIDGSTADSFSFDCSHGECFDSSIECPLDSDQCFIDCSNAHRCDDISIVSKAGFTLLCNDDDTTVCSGITVECLHGDCEMKHNGAYWECDGDCNWNDETTIAPLTTASPLTTAAQLTTADPLTTAASLGTTSPLTTTISLTTVTPLTTVASLATNAPLTTTSPLTTASPQTTTQLTTAAPLTTNVPLITESLPTTSTAVETTMVTTEEPHITETVVTTQSPATTEAESVETTSAESIETTQSESLESTESQSSETTQSGSFESTLSESFESTVSVSTSVGSTPATTQTSISNSVDDAAVAAANQSDDGGFSIQNNLFALWILLLALVIVCTLCTCCACFLLFRSKQKKNREESDADDVDVIAMMTAAPHTTMEAIPIHNDVSEGESVVSLSKPPLPEAIEAADAKPDHGEGESLIETGYGHDDPALNVLIQPVQQSGMESVITSGSSPAAAFQHMNVGSRSHFDSISISQLAPSMVGSTPVQQQYDMGDEIPPGSLPFLEDSSEDGSSENMFAVEPAESSMLEQLKPITQY